MCLIKQEFRFDGQLVTLGKDRIYPSAENDSSVPRIFEFRAECDCP
ncbi:MAG TPA: hypothetical protein V6D23_12700 [Candidatus Obscuribacterales bacterium]